MQISIRRAGKEELDMLLSDVESSATPVDKYKQLSSYS
jgi:hypothetical protein